MNNGSVTCFGTGDGWPSAERNHSSYLYRLGGAGLLIDCGESIDRSYKASGLGYEAFDTILLSHLHADHFGGFFMLMQGCWLERRRKPLPVYLPRRAIPVLRAMLHSAFIFDELLPFRFALLPLQNGGAFRVKNVRVRVFRTSHLDGYRAKFGTRYRVDYNSYAFTLEAGDTRVGHSADLGTPEDLEPLLAKPLDLLVCELAHFSPEALFAYLRGRRIGQVVFVHLTRALRANLPALRRLAARSLGGLPHTFARDGQELAF